MDSQGEVHYYLEFLQHRPETMIAHPLEKYHFNTTMHLIFNPVFLGRFSHIYQNVQAVELRCSYPQIVSGNYIAAFLESTSQSNVRAINIVDGLFGLYGHARNTQQVRVDNIKELKFKTTTIGFRHVFFYQMICHTWTVLDLTHVHP